MKACIVCGRAIKAGSRCSRHKLKRPWYNDQWVKISRQRRLDHPMCEICHTRASTEVDHIIARSLAGGVRALCHPCHVKYGSRHDAYEREEMRDRE